MGFLRWLIYLLVVTLMSLIHLTTCNVESIDLKREECKDNSFIEFGQSPATFQSNNNHDCANNSNCNYNNNNSNNSKRVQLIRDLVQVIQTKQHPPKDQCRSQRFLVLQMCSKLCFEGTGSILKQVLLGAAIAMHSNRTLVWGLGLPFSFEHTQELWMGVGKENLLINDKQLNCSQSDSAAGAYGCFFEPISSCSLADASAVEMLSFAENAYNESSRILLAEVRKGIAAYMPPLGLFRSVWKGNKQFYGDSEHEFNRLWKARSSNDIAGRSEGGQIREASVVEGEGASIWGAAIAAYVFRLKPDLLQQFQHMRKNILVEGEDKKKEEEEEEEQEGRKNSSEQQQQQQQQQQQEKDGEDRVQVDLGSRRRGGSSSHHISASTFASPESTWGIHVRHGDLKALQDKYWYRKVFEFEDYFAEAQLLSHKRKQTPQKLFVATDSASAELVPLKYAKYNEEHSYYTALEKTSCGTEDCHLLGIDDQDVHGNSLCNASHANVLDYWFSTSFDQLGVVNEKNEKEDEKDEKEHQHQQQQRPFGAPFPRLIIVGVINNTASNNTSNNDRYRTEHGSHTVAADGGCVKDPLSKANLFTTSEARGCALPNKDVLKYQKTDEFRDIPRSNRIMRVLLESIEDIYLLSQCDVLIASGSSHFSTLASLLVLAHTGGDFENTVSFLDQEAISAGLVPTAFLHGGTYKETKLRSATSASGSSKSSSSNSRNSSRRSSSDGGIANKFSSCHDGKHRLGISEEEQAMGDARWAVHTNSFISSLKRRNNNNRFANNSSGRGSINTSTSCTSGDDEAKGLLDRSVMRILNGLPFISEPVFQIEVNQWLTGRDFIGDECECKRIHDDITSTTDSRHHHQQQKQSPPLQPPPQQSLQGIVTMINEGVLHFEQLHPGRAMHCWSYAISAIGHLQQQQQQEWQRQQRPSDSVSTTTTSASASSSSTTSFISLTTDLDELLEYAQNNAKSYQLLRYADYVTNNSNYTQDDFVNFESLFKNKELERYVHAQGRSHTAAAAAADINIVVSSQETAAAAAAAATTTVAVGKGVAHSSGDTNYKKNNLKKGGMNLLSRICSVKLTVINSGESCTFREGGGGGGRRGGGRAATHTKRSSQGAADVPSSICGECRDWFSLQK